MHPFLEKPPSRKQLKQTFLDPFRSELPKDQLNCIAHMILVFEDPVEVANVALDYLIDQLGTCRADLGFVKPADTLYAPVTVAYNNATAPLRCDDAVYSNKASVLRRTWSQNAPIACDEVASHPYLVDSRAQFIEIESKSILFQRLTFGRAPVGMMCLDFTHHVHQWSTAETNLVANFAKDALGPLAGISCHWKARQGDPAAVRKPTEAEMDAIRLAAAGLNYAEIGKQLGKSTRTIENQLRSARMSLQACNRAELVRKCEMWL